VHGLKPPPREWLPASLRIDPSVDSWNVPGHGARAPSRVRLAPPVPHMPPRTIYVWHLPDGDGLLSRQQRMKSLITGLVSASGGQATPTWLGLTPVTGR